MDYKDISLNGFADHCHYLKRVPHASCESGNDYDCGPIDPAFPGRWVLPCGHAGGDVGDQILGGSNGKMAYQIPNVHMEDAVIQNYWWTANACMEPSGFMENYKYPQAWGNCAGDGGVVGGKPIHHRMCDEPGQWPEEFWNCADVQVLGESQGDGATAYSYDGPSYEGKGTTSGADGKQSDGTDAVQKQNSDKGNTNNPDESKTHKSNSGSKDTNGSGSSANNGGGGYSGQGNGGNGQGSDQSHGQGTGYRAFKPHR